MMYPMYYDYGFGHWVGFGIVGVIISLIIWVVIIAVFVRILAWAFGGGHRRRERWRHWHEMSRGQSALDILNERYVKGEINKEEYEQKKKDILTM